MKNDIRNLYWPGLYNVKFVHNCSGSMLVMLVAMSRSDKVTLGINNYSVVWIENLVSNFKHFHISAMLNNRITADNSCQLQ